MPTSRRNFVFFMGIGGATIASLTAAGFLYRAADRGSFSGFQEGNPFRSWQEWSRRQLSVHEAVALAGTLACSSLNSQPWWLRLKQDSIDLYFRRTSYPLFLDPFDRQALMGLGACIENMAVAAEGLGHPAKIALLPSQNNVDHIARLDLTPDIPNETARYTALVHRHTNRGPYDPERLPPADTLSALERLSPSGPASVILFSSASRKGQDFARATLEAAEAISAEPAMITEHFLWFRQTMDQIRATSNGISFLTSGLTDLQVRTAMALPDVSEHDFINFWLQQTRDVHLPRTPLFGLLCVEDNTNPAHLLEAGRLLQRLHLEATAQGLAMQALSHVNWMADREEARGQPAPTFRNRAAALAGDMGAMVLGLRLGYARRPARAAPRQSLPSVLVPHLGPRPSPRPE